MPEPIRFTVRVENVGKETIQNVALQGDDLIVGSLSHPQKVLEQVVEYVGRRPKPAKPKESDFRPVLPKPADLKIGTLRPGQKSKGVVYLYEADGDGTVSVEAVATGRVGSARRLGRGELVLRIGTQVLFVTARKGHSAASKNNPDLIQAGTAFAVIVSVENRSHERAALFIPGLDGLRGNARGGVWRKHKPGQLDSFVAASQQRDTPLFAARVEPRKTAELDVVFVSDASSYTFDAAADRNKTETKSKPVGGVRADVLIAKPSAVAPPAEDPKAPFEKWQNLDPKLVVRPKDKAKVSYSFDDGGMTRRPWNNWTSPIMATRFATVGLVEGLGSWAWGTVRGVVWDLPNMVREGIAGLPSASIKYTGQAVAYWKSIENDPAAKAAFLARLQAAMLSLGNTELAALATREGPKLWDAVNDKVLTDLTQMSAEWESGDWQAAARSGGFFAGPIVADVVTAPVIEVHALRWARGAKLALLAKSSAAADALKAAELARQADLERQIAARIDEVVGAREANDILKLAKPAGIGAGYLLDALKLRKLIGLSDEQVKWLANFAAQNKVLLTVRSRGEEALKWLDPPYFGFLKPELIKTKTVNRFDVDFLGYDPADLGRIALLPPGHKFPKLDAIRAKMRKMKIPPGSEEEQAVLKRLNQRQKEIIEERRRYEKWNADGQVDFEWNWIDNAIDPSKAPTVPTVRAKFKLVPEPCQPAPCAYPPLPKGTKKLVPMVDPDGKGFRPITGDVDAVGLTDIDGRPLPDEVYARLVDEIRRGPVGASHPTTDTWVKNGEFWHKAKEEQLLNDGDCCFAQFGPDGSARAVMFDLAKSLVKPPFDRTNHYLHWAGGYVHPVGAHGAAARTSFELRRAPLSGMLLAPGARGWRAEPTGRVRRRGCMPTTRINHRCHGPFVDVGTREG